MKRIVCIGTTKLPREDVGFLDSIGQRTVLGGDLLITGNAPGSDQAYALGGNMVNASMVELCLPWPTFEQKCIMVDPDPKQYPHWREMGMSGGNRLRYAQNATYDHLRLANEAHPIFSFLAQGQQKLLIRNAMMMISDDGVISDLVIARPRFEAQGWGGTGHAMRVAQMLSIPVWLVNRSCWWDGVIS